MICKESETYAVPGFLANGVHAGIKENGIKDLAMIFSVVPARASAVFTRNCFKAAPVLLDMERIKSGMAQAILANSGNANAATGEAGYADAVDMSRCASDKLNIAEELVLVASTGIIGHRPPVTNIKEGMEGLVGGLNPNGIPAAAEAIMTTDKFPKISCRKDVIGGREISVCGIAKGAGMIEPHMATMLAFAMTDADIDFHTLNSVFKQAIDKSFNAITVDGCMSTNDTAIILANGVARNKQLKRNSNDLSLFKEMLMSVMSDLSDAIIRDGEGATKFIEIIVDEADSIANARKVAYAVANSNLVKTAFYGCDPNWGRIIAAAGSTGISLPVAAVKLYFEEVPVFAHGKGINGHDKELTEIMSRTNIKVLLKLGMGNKSYRICTSDLTLDYIRINAHYHT
ncbi:MAG: bifunctional glutamate N-acetyltransferase/amino-acid acetyltransferase ArgJ [Syntrophales bacterium]